MVLYFAIEVWNTEVETAHWICTKLLHQIAQIVDQEKEPKAVTWERLRNSAKLFF
jgi:hypothetical protein